MIKSLCLLVVALLATNLWSITTGLGMSLKFDTDGNTLYIPVDLTDNFRVEPMVEFNADSYEYDNNEYEDDINLEKGDETRESSEYLLGIGFFMKHKYQENYSLYYGLRLGYISGMYEYEDNEEDPESGTISTFKREESYSGLEIAPSIGFEYYIFDKLSLCGEAAYYYDIIDAEGEFAQTYHNDTYSYSESGDYKGSINESGTKTKFIVRFYF